MAESLIADLFKTPADVRQEETDRLLEQGTASAEAYLTGAGQGGSPISGAIRGLTAQALQSMPLDMSNVVRRGMLGLSGGQVGASQAERQAAQLNAIAQAATGRKPEEIRKAAERARAAGRGDIAMVLEDRALKLEKNMDKIVNKEVQYQILQRLDPEIAEAFRDDPEATFTAYYKLAKGDASKGVTLTDDMAFGALKEEYEAAGLGEPTAADVAELKRLVAQPGMTVPKAIRQLLGGGGNAPSADRFDPANYGA
jgi:hypothetical protein